MWILSSYWKYRKVIPCFFRVWGWREREIKFLNSDSTFLVLVKIVSLKLFVSLWNQHFLNLIFSDSPWWIICLKSWVRRLWGDYSSGWISVFRNASLTPSGKHVALTSTSCQQQWDGPWEPHLEAEFLTWMGFGAIWNWMRQSCISISINCFFWKNLAVFSTMNIGSELLVSWVMSTVEIMVSNHILVIVDISKHCLCSMLFEITIDLPPDFVI